MPGLDSVEHVVVVALENRSFDHLIGFLKGPNYPIDGLDGDEFNFDKPNDPNSRRVLVSPDAPAAPDLSPSPAHDLSDVTIQVYGAACVPSTPPAEHNNGFVYDYSRVVGVSGAAADRVMRCYAPPTLPVLSTLAREFALCDCWHSSVPGPTWPNRFFLHAATSGGAVDNNVRDYRMRTIFENLAEAGRSWRIYFHDLPQSLALANLRGSLSNFSLFDEQFARDCANGSLPHYTFIEPRYFDFLWLQANDQHPPHSVLPGEHLLADIYENLRSSPVWNNSVLVITWDEHGGLYDHVLPPACLNPDGLEAPDFAFERLGLRVPTVIVSPWVARGTIEKRLYEHASLPAFLKRVFQLPRFLTQRDAAANTFESVLSLPAPRADTPTHLTRPAAGAAALPVPGTLRELAAEQVLTATAAGQRSSAPLTDLQTSLTALAHDLAADDTPLQRTARLAARVATEHDAAVHVLGVAARVFGM